MGDEYNQQDRMRKLQLNQTQCHEAAEAAAKRGVANMTNLNFVDAAQDFAEAQGKAKEAGRIRSSIVSIERQRS